MGWNQKKKWSHQQMVFHRYALVILGNISLAVKQHLTCSICLIQTFMQPSSLSVVSVLVAAAM